MARRRSFGDITMGKDLKVLKKENNGDRFQIWGTYRFQEKRRAKERSVGDRMMGNNARILQNGDKGEGESFGGCVLEAKVLRMGIWENDIFGKSCWQKHAQRKGSFWS